MPFVFLVLLLTAVESTLFAQTFQPSESAKSSLDWAGTYVGTLPCADCQGIYTVVTLNNKNEYVLRETRIGKSKTAVVKKGSFDWQKDGTRIIFKGQSNYQFMVSENRLIRLDSKGQAIPTTNKEAYILRKTDNEITEKYWKLTELMGKPLDRSNLSKEPHLIFKKDTSSRFHGFAGCNSIGGTFALSKGEKITLSKIHATLMACPAMQIESSFLQALESVAYYALNKDKLTLKNAQKKPVAQFEAVWLH